MFHSNFQSSLVDFVDQQETSALPSAENSLQAAHELCDGQIAISKAEINNMDKEYAKLVSQIRDLMSM